MFVSTFISFFVATSSGLADPPKLLDTPLADYYTRAVKAFEAGERHKALAMLELLLIPAETPVAVSYAGVSEQALPAFRRGVENGLNLWKQALGDDFPLRIVPSAPRDGSVQVSFANSIGGRADHKGEINTKRRIQWNRELHYFEFSAEITVSKFGFNKRLLEEGDITHVVAHEVGHALGLRDAANTQSIMGPVAIGSAYARINSNEVAAVRDFRKLVRGQILRINASAAGKRSQPRT